jgi:pyruvate formate lyase activating enzyme
MKLCHLYKKEKNSVRCLACSHKCLIKKNKTGICSVRKNINGKLYLLVYGQIVAEHVDPIEKKPLFHFLPGTISYSIGTVGCNFKCDWCQNFDISQASKQGIIFGKKRTPEQIVKSALEENCKSIAYTYNEPAIWSEFIKKTSKLAKKFKIKNILVTNGYFSKESLDYLNGLIDAANIDLKSFKEETYQKYCGAKLKPVLETIKKMHRQKVHIEITTLLIPELNDSKEELKEIAEFIYSIDNKGEIPWHISRFFPMYKMFDKKITSIETLKTAEEIGRQAGLKFVHLGNI